MTLTHVQWEEGRAAHEERQCPRPGALSPFPLNVGVRGWTCCSQEAKGFMGMTFTHNHPPEASQLASLALSSVTLTDCFSGGVLDTFS